jgi:cytochrome c oxidase subunit 4
MSDHVVSAKVYVTVFLALVALTVITVVAAHYDFEPYNVIVAVGIAIAKATLVVLFFMHARYASGLTRLVILAALAFFFILIFLTMSDYVTRSWSLTAIG